MGVLRYASHGDAVKGPSIPVAWWSLNDLGRAQAAALATMPWGGETAQVVSSAEPKAIEMASPFAAACGLVGADRPI